MAGEKFNLHGKTTVTPKDSDMVVVEIKDPETQKITVHNTTYQILRNWIMSTALYEALATTAKNIIGSINELKESITANVTGINNLTESVATNTQNIESNTASLNAIAKHFDLASANEIMDCDNATDNLKLYIAKNEALNKPTNNIWYMIEVKKAYANNLMQFAYPINDFNNENFYFRVYTPSGWSAWREVSCKTETLLWEGRTTTAGDIPLLDKCVGFSQYIITTGGGPSLKQEYVANISKTLDVNRVLYHTNAIGGIVKLQYKDNTTFTLSGDLTQPLRSIYGVK